MQNVRIVPGRTLIRVRHIPSGVPKLPAPPFIELCARNARETWARKRDALRAKAGVITGRASYTRAPFEERER